MNAAALSAIQACSRRLPVSSDSLKALEAKIGVPLPADYVALMQMSNGIEGFVGDNYLMIRPVEDVLAYGSYDFAPQYLFIGSDGAGEGFAFDLSESDRPVVNVTFIGAGSDAPRRMGANVTELILRLHERPLFP